MKNNIVVFGVVLVGLLLVCIVGGTPGFPSDFVWGSATASYQVEGAWNISRGLSIWDVFSKTPGKTHNGDTGDVANDQYHRYEEDIQTMKGLGIKNYRLSLSWSRFFPTGELPLNEVAVAHYNRLINLLLANGIEPFVTLYHWDLPNDLHTSFGGWLSPRIVPAFRLYAETVFRRYGDRVKKWITFNEPLSFTNLGYGNGIHAPGRCSDRTVCPTGRGIDPKLVKDLSNLSIDSGLQHMNAQSGKILDLAAHHVLLAHAEAVYVYRTYFQREQKGIIGITLNIDWAEPYTNSAADKAAAERHLEWQLSWYADPVSLGDYPQSMKTAIGLRLPQFTAEQKRLLNGSWDYFGMNHYTSGYVYDNPNQQGQGWNEDQKLVVTSTRDGKQIGPQADSFWLYVVPWGINRVLHWIADRYGNPPIYITENGVSVPHESALPLEQALHDQFRIDFYSQCDFFDVLLDIGNVSLAISEKVNVKGYFAWSFMDNFEWADGYSVRFGLHYVDYNDGIKRIPKDSAKWFSNLINS